MAGCGMQGGERCRFCGLELPSDAVTVMAHINTHWRQLNLETMSLSPCAFEPQLDLRVSNTPLNPEDLEVSGHMEQQTFQYTYSPQTEPSNLTMSGGARCSPLNLTGRPKSVSPLSPPLPHTGAPEHPPPAPPPPQHHHHQASPVVVAGPPPLPPSSHCHYQFSLGTLTNPQGLPAQVPPMSLPPNMEQVPPVETVEDSLKRKRRLERHEEYRCHVCGRCLYTRPSLDEHLEDHLKHSTASYLMPEQQLDVGGHTGPATGMPCPTAPGKPYKCAMCDQEFTYKEELQEHTESHEAAKPYKCELCGAGLSHVSALRRHRLAHTGYRPHRCDVCSRSFSQKCDLQRHYGTHGRNRQFVCGVCKKKYSSLHFLENHKCKPPEEPKPFRCNICGEGCTNNMAWSYHMWKHTKNPIFVPFQDKFSLQPGQTEIA